MKEINQVTALRTKFLLHLIGYPRCTVAHTMNGCTCAKPGLHGTVKEALPSSVDTALERATKGKCFAALRVRKTYLGLLPAQRFAFALVSLGWVNVDDGHHAAVCLNNDCSADARLCRPALRWWGCLKYSFGMTFGDPRYGAFTQHNPVVLNEFVHGLGEGLVCTKVGYCALQRSRAASVAHLGTLRKRADSFCVFSVLGFINADVSKGGVPAEFFLPSRHTWLVCLHSCEVFSTWC